MWNKQHNQYLKKQNWFAYKYVIKCNTTLTCYKKSQYEVTCEMGPLTQTWSSFWWPSGSMAHEFSRFPSGGLTPSRYGHQQDASRHSDWQIRSGCTTSHHRLTEYIPWEQCHQRCMGSSRHCHGRRCWSRSGSGYAWRHLWAKMEQIKE